MEHAILQPLEVRREGRTVAVPGGKPRAVLAALLMHAKTWHDAYAAGATLTIDEAAIIALEAHQLRSVA